MPVPPTVVIHNLAHARAALAAAEATGVAIRLSSAPGAAAYAGAAWFLEMVAAARADHPGARAEAVLDCGAEAGLALGAIRSGIEAIRIRVTPRMRARLGAIAAAAGCRLVANERAPTLDLLATSDPERAVRDWLAQRAPRD